MSCPSFDFHVDYFDILVGLVVFIHLHVLNAMDYFETAQHTSENRVLVVKPRRRCRSDEELRPVGIGARIGHAHGVWSVMPQFARELILELVSPNTVPTSAVA